MSKQSQQISSYFKLEYLTVAESGKSLAGMLSLELMWSIRICTCNWCCIWV